MIQWNSPSLTSGFVLNQYVLLGALEYPLVNKQLDPENHQFLMETSLPTPMTARVYVNLPEGMNGLFSPVVGMMIQSDELIFFRGVETTN